MNIKINFEKLQECLGSAMPLREHSDGFISIATCDKEWAPRLAYCGRDAFIGAIEDYIKEHGIEEFIASHLLNTQFLK